MSLLTIIQKAADRLSLRRPSAVVTSADQQVRQLLALANEEGESLSKRGNWQALVAEWTFVTSATEAQTNAPVPPDMREFLPNSFFNRTQSRRLIGPIAPQQYQAIQAQQVNANIYLSFRRRQNAFLISPAPAAGETIAYEYLSSFWAKSDAHVPKAGFTADTDTAFLDEELIVQGLRWRFKQANGLDYSEEMRTYELSVERALADGVGASALSQGVIASPDYPLGRPNIPEGNFGVS